LELTMQKIWLPDGLLKRFKQAFIPSHYTPFALQTLKQQERRSWYTEGRKGIFLTDTKIAAHLEGRYWVGPVPKTFTRSIILDLDRGRNWKSLDRRTEQVRAAFPEADPLIFSTPRGGRHLHFMIRPAWSDRTAAFTKERLSEAGVELAPGEVEVFPAGAKAIRAPLGRDCFLLDKDTLKPVSPDRETNLYTLDEILEAEGYDRLAIPEEYQAAELPQTLQTPQRATRRRTERSGSEYMLQVDRLLREGLWRPSQRHDALCELNWYHHVIERKSGNQVAGILWTWIQEKHNGLSQDYRTKPDWVRRNIEGLVKAWNPAKVGTKSTYKAAEASRSAENNLDGAIQEFLEAAPLDGRERAFLGRVLRYAHSRGNDTLDGYELEVQIPSRTLKSWDWQYGPLLRVLVLQGYIGKAKSHGANIGRCATYQVLRLD
jgi:hypothetical protein